MSIISDLEAVDSDKVWEDVLAGLRAEGIDTDALIEQAARNISLASEARELEQELVLHRVLDEERKMRVQPTQNLTVQGIVGVSDES